MQKIEKSKLADNTIVVFTADYATHQDSEFTFTFPDCDRASSVVDKVLLCIYYKGITPELYEVNGRNSLDLAPTILDYLDISTPNYFLGQNLFADETVENDFDTISHEGTTLLTTQNGIVKNLVHDGDFSIETLIQQYLVVKLQDQTVSVSKETEDLFSSRIESELSEDGAYLEAIYTPLDDETYSHIWFPIWSSKNGQDDIIRYLGIQYEDGTWHATITLSNHALHGELNIHVYGGEAASDRLSTVAIILN